ncbi:sirohydrochlorin chelatase [Thermopirellula anaerolimosa]
MPERAEPSTAATPTDSGAAWPVARNRSLPEEEARNAERRAPELCRDSTQDVGVLLVGHGTREPSGIEQTWELCRLVETSLRHRGFGGAFALAFLELAQPSIAAALPVVRDGAIRRLIVAPLMLFAAGHVRRDIPHEVRTALGDHRLPAVRYLDAFNDDPAVLRLSLRRERDALGLPPDRDDATEETYYLFVARGNRDPEALAATRRVLELRARQSRRRHYGLAYLAMARPTLDEALDRAARGPWHRVIVQPHLLFRGLLERELRAKVAQRAQQRPDITWVVTDVLGPDSTLADSLAANISAAITPQP